MKNKIVLLGLLLALRFPAFGQPITFADPNLELAVRQQLSQPTGQLTAAAVSTIQTLSASEMGIRDLTGLEALTGLNFANFAGNPLTNLSSLPSLLNLRTLYLHSCSLSNLTFASHLSQVRALSLADNRFQDLSPLAGLTDLQSLWLGWGNGAVTNWWVLSNLVHLAELQLQGDGILKVDFASNLHELTALDLYNNGVRDISPLAGLTNLESLALHWNGCTNLPLVAGLIKLRALNLAGNGLADISFLIHLVELRSLLVDNSYLKVLPNLTWWPHLEHLDLTANRITNTLNPASLVATNLQELYLGNNALGHAQFLTNLPSIRTLNLDQNGVADASPVASLANLSALSIAHNRLTNIQALLSLSNLVSADLRWNDLDFAAGAPALAQLEALLGRGVNVQSSPQNDLPLPLGQALDAPGLTWITGDDYPWSGSSGMSHDGTDAALSSALPDGAQSWLQTTVSGPGTVGFWWAVSSETNWDFLVFLLDGQTNASLSGQVAWRWQTVFVPAGDHTLRWAYSKDPFCCSSGQDAGWLDQVTFWPALLPTITLQPSNQWVGLGGAAAFGVQATGSAPFHYQWQFNGSALPLATNLTLTFTAATADQAGNYSVIITNLYGSVTSTVATLTLTNLPTAGNGPNGKLDVKSLLAAGWASAACSALDIGQLSDAFDGNTNTLIRTPAINPLVITLTFTEPQNLTGFRLWFQCGDNRWKVESAATLGDLNSQNPATTYRALVTWRTDPEWHWAEASLARPFAARFLRLTLQRLTGDGYVHLCEWELRTQLQVDWMASPDRTSGRLHWSASPYSYYAVQTSTDLTHWLDTETVMASGPSTTSSLLLCTNRPARFFRATPLAQPPELPFITKKVLIINYDPILTNHGGVRLHEYYHWGDPHQLTAGYLGDLTEISSNYVRWVPTFLDVNEWPVKADGFTYNENSYLGAWTSNSFHQPDAVDYPRVIQRFDLDRRVQNGEVDEVIIWGGPYLGFYESQMVGATAYWCNSPPITHPSVPLYVIMALNPERGLDCALESFGHRSESILCHVYGSWSSDTTINHLWDKFTRIQKNAPGLAACGNVHYPPNGVADYDYSNAAYVDSLADDWLLNYPNFKGLSRRFNAAEWNFDHHLYLKWWLGHMPHQPGRYTDGKLNNWWGYLVDFNRYQESR